MERITNVRISTLTKSVSHDGDVNIVSVGLNNGHVFAADSEGNTHDMGAIIISNIEIATPQVASEGCGCNTPNANVIAKLLRGVDGVDGITPDMSDYYDKNDVDKRLSGKQDVISDIDNIRSNALKGATAVQPASLANYVSKDDVDAELSETSANPIQNQAVHTALEEMAYGFGQFLNQKQGTISDLDAIRQGAAKGATALQASDVDSEVSETSTNPVQNKAVAEAVKGAFNEIVDLLDATLSSVDGRFDSKQDKLVSGENIKTINGESIVGEGNIEIEGGSADLEGYATEEYVNNAVEAVNVKGEDGYVYSNGEKVDMRIRRSLIPIGTLIPANADLKTIAYLKVGNYYCSQTSNAVTIKNCPVDVAFSMEVFNPLSEILDDETTAQYTYRIRKITAYNTGVQYIQYCNTSGTAGTWTYGSWYVVPRTSFSLASDKNGGSAVKGGSTRGVYIDASGTFQQMGYTIATSVPKNAVFTDTNTKVTAVGNHYAPVEDESVVIEAPAGEVVVGLKRDAAGHVVGVMSTPMSSGGGGGGGGIAVETDPVFSASPAATITEEKMAEWDKGATAVQPETLAGYASEGYVDAEVKALRDSLAEVASSGSYNDLQDKPNIPSAINIAGTNYTPSGNGIIDLNSAGLYRKPSGGIPKEDFSSEVQTSLRNADAYKGTVTGVKINGTTKSSSNGVIDLGNIPTSIPTEVYIADFTMDSLRVGMYNGTDVDCNLQALVDAMNANKVILVREDEDSAYKGVFVLNGYAEDLIYFSIVDTSGNILWCDGTDYNNLQGIIDVNSLHMRSWDGKQDTLKSGENIKTINGESILGSGDITIGGGSGTLGSAQLPLNSVSLNLPEGRITIPSGKVTEFTAQLTGGCTFALSLADKKVGEDNVWVIRFAISIDNSSIYQVVTDEGYSIKWANGVAPTFENGKYYELSFRLIGQTFLGVWASFE